MEKDVNQVAKKTKVTHEEMKAKFEEMELVRMQFKEMEAEMKANESEEEKEKKSQAKKAATEALVERVVQDGAKWGKGQE